MMRKHNEKLNRRESKATLGGDDIQFGMTGFQTFLACILRWASFRTRSCRPETSLTNSKKCTSTMSQFASTLQRSILVVVINKIMGGFKTCLACEAGGLVWKAKFVAVWWIRAMCLRLRTNNSKRR